ncbi:MAG: transposase [Candidatus Acetothermia bacterium]|jgi:REP element-mobilizing transposase RayT|nr:transposase [Candidatus Acetothermia bacterium]MDH7504843.1 transposase [Candidatus Acetothermia bacterium]
MARPLRIEFPGAVYHVTSRGNALEEIYRDDADREAFLDVLAQAVERFHWLCHAYCLMGNHYHLLVETLQPTLSRGMRHLNGVYTQWFNRRHQRVGHLFQGRFKAILVEKEAYLLELCRYVVLNPVRAKLVRAANGWPWSSYRATAGLAEPPPFLTTDWVLGQFSEDREEAQRRYRRFVAAGKGVAVWHELKGQIYLGSDAFIEQLPKPAVAVREIPRLQRQGVRPSLEKLFAGAALGQAIAAAYRDHGYTMKEIADYLGVHYATVSRRLRGQEMLDCKT